METFLPTFSALHLECISNEGQMIPLATGSKKSTAMNEAVGAFDERLY